MSDRVSAIEVREVTRLFGATAALRGISCGFEAGTLTFVQGPNGAGKSTLLAILATILRPTSGSVSYHPFGKAPSVARRHIGWVAHESHCYRDLSGHANVAFSAELHGCAEAERIRQAGDRVGALGFWDQPVGTMSRGQRQRISLARAIVHEPSVLLLDEPTSGLDAASLARFEDVVVEERDQGAIVVVISHRDEWMNRLAGRRVRLERGRLVDPS